MTTFKNTYLEQLFTFVNDHPLLIVGGLFLGGGLYYYYYYYSGPGPDTDISPSLDIIQQASRIETSNVEDLGLMLNERLMSNKIEDEPIVSQTENLVNTSNVEDLSFILDEKLMLNLIKDKSIVSQTENLVNTADVITNSSENLVNISNNIELPNIQDYAYDKISFSSTNSFDIIKTLSNKDAVYADLKKFNQLNFNDFNDLVTILKKPFTDFSYFDLELLFCPQTNPLLRNYNFFSFIDFTKIQPEVLHQYEVDRLQFSNQELADILNYCNQNQLLSSDLLAKLDANITNNMSYLKGADGSTTNVVLESIEDPELSSIVDSNFIFFRFDQQGELSSFVLENFDSVTGMF